MNWNDSLYWSWRERGGDFYSSTIRRDSGVLFLDTPHGPAVIQCNSVSGKNGTMRREISVTLRASLERPCHLTVRKERFPRPGEEQEKSEHREEDGEAYQLNVRRSIRSSNPRLTPHLVQNRHLQKLLNADPGAWLQISPVTGGLIHLVSVRRDAENLEEAVDSQGRAAGRDEPNQRKLYAESGFREQMDSMVDLAQAAREEVDLWPRQSRGAGKAQREDKL